MTQSLQRLSAGEGVPFLAAYRYKESGLRKRAAWEHTWDPAEFFREQLETRAR